MNKFMKRAIMTLLFFAALLTTFQSISGVEAKDLSLWMYSYKQETKKESVSFHSLRRSTLKEKSISRLAPTDTLISSQSIIRPNSLEEAVNWERYPSDTVVATGYTAGIESTGKTEDHPEYGITYSGVRVMRDLYSTIAADLSVYPLGTILFIPGYGYGVVADKGGAIKGNKIDLYYETVEDVYREWGKKKVEVYVIERGDGDVTEQEIMELNSNASMKVFRQQMITG